MECAQSRSMSKKTIVAAFAAAGFAVGMGLCGYAFYLTSRHQIGNAFLFVVLCPPSIGAMALDSAGVFEGIVGWVFISAMNSGLYSLMGLFVARVSAANSK
jgi:hypothetical protein